MLNKIMLIGNLGRDPDDLKVTNEGTPFTKFSLAVNRSFRSKSGDSREETEWFNIVVWNKLAEVCEQYLHKGTKVYIEGRLTQRKYTDKEGIQRVSVEVVASDMQILTPKSASGSSNAEHYSSSSNDNSDPFLPDFPDDL